VVRSATVLLVEDDASVREFARRSLGEAGYTVLAASDADQAFRASEAWSEEIHVLVTDLVMPGVHGANLAARIRLERPDMGVVFISGYSAEMVDRAHEPFVSGEFLPKPFTVEALRAAVGRAADGRGRELPD
jgi:two-component system cell cycle sensor histidine kinase/response regulator CckA